MRIILRRQETTLCISHGTHIIIHELCKLARRAQGLFIALVASISICSLGFCCRNGAIRSLPVGSFRNVDIICWYKATRAFGNLRYSAGRSLFSFTLVSDCLCAESVFFLDKSQRSKKIRHQLHDPTYDALCDFWRRGRNNGRRLCCPRWCRWPFHDVMEDYGISRNNLRGIGGCRNMAIRFGEDGCSRLRVGGKECRRKIRVQSLSFSMTAIDGWRRGGLSRSEIPIMSPINTRKRDYNSRRFGCSPQTAITQVIPPILS